MRRQDKFPDTQTFHFYNANPHNRYTTDCVIRAVCTALEQPWEQTLKDLAEIAVKKGVMVDDVACYGEYLRHKGWVKRQQPRKTDNTKYTGKDFCKSSICEWGRRYIAHIGGHHIVAIVNKRVWDIWNSTDGCIGNYWVKP